MSRSLSRLQAVVLGAAVLVGLALATLGVFAVGSRQWLWSDTFHATVGFKNIRGVEVGTRVRVQGVEAGEVVAVEAPAKHGGDVRLRLRLDAKLRHLLRADASAQIISEGMLGGRALEIDPGTDRAGPLAGDAIASRPTLELSEAISQLGGLIEAVEKEKGKIGEVVANTNTMLRKATEAVESIHQGVEGVKRMPLLRNYIEDPNELVFRPNSERNRQCFAATELFESGRAVLTAQGQQRLQELVPWLAGLSKHDGAEVVVLAFADPKSPDAALARTLTQQQSETVGNFLKNQNAIHKRFGLFARKLTTRGLGTQPSPVQEKEPLPPARVEVVVFVPQG